jgi:hypothetical protein
MYLLRSPNHLTMSHNDEDEEVVIPIFPVANGFRAIQIIRVPKDVQD